MIIVGDIGNTETKVCLIDKSNKIIKKIIIKTKDINNNSLSLLLTKLKLSKINIKKVLFCSVVPKAFNQIKKIFYQNLKIKIYELKDLDLKKMINIKVNYKQIGSDRLANALSVIGENPKNDIYYSTGGGPEGVLAAAALSCFGGQIQGSSHRALKNGIKLKDVFQIVRKFKKANPSKPLILMGYYNLIYQNGENNFLKNCKNAGVDGLIIVDLPWPENKNFAKKCKEKSISFVQLISPTTTKARMRKIIKDSHDMIYYISILSTTG